MLKLASMIDYISLFIEGSIIDHPRERLDESVWNVSEKVPIVKDKVKDRLLDGAYSLLDDMDFPEEKLVGVYFVGSMLGTQYTPKADLDVTLVIKEEDLFELYPKLKDEELLKEFLSKFLGKINGELLEGTKHPINYYIWKEDGKGLFLDKFPGAIYDLEKDNWIKEPEKMEDLDEEYFDPDLEFAEEREEAEQLLTSIDELLAETKRDTVDAAVLQEAVEGAKNPEYILGRLEDKIKEMEQDIGSLVEEYEDIHEKRKELFSEDALEDVEKSKDWASENVIYKYLTRWKYIDVLGKLKKIFKDGITEKEVEDVAEVLKLENHLRKTLRLF